MDRHLPSRIPGARALAAAFSALCLGTLVVGTLNGGGSPPQAPFPQTECPGPPSAPPTSTQSPTATDTPAAKPSPTSTATATSTNTPTSTATASSTPTCTPTN